MVDLSIVVPSLKPPEELEVVQYLDRCPFDDYEVIVRDDAPVTKARNEGYRRANAEKILFLDDDSQPQPGYLQEASETLETEYAVAGKTVHPRDDFLSGQLTAHYNFGDEPRYVDRFWGCNMGLRKEALDAVGGWDEQMGWGHEEKELANRVTEQYRILYNPRMVVHHAYANSMFDYWEKQYKLELCTPYLWSKQGLSKRQMWSQTLTDVLNLSNYLGRSLTLTLARTGRTLASAAGRIVGMRRHRGSKSHETRNYVESEL